MLMSLLGTSSTCDESKFCATYFSIVNKVHLVFLKFKITNIFKSKIFFEAEQFLAFFQVEHHCIISQSKIRGTLRHSLRGE